MPGRGRGRNSRTVRAPMPRPREPSPDEDDQDIIELSADDGLMERIQREAEREESGDLRPTKRYDALTTARLGMERISDVANSETFHTLPIMVIENQIHLLNRYYELFFKSPIHEKPKTAKQMVEFQQKVNDFDQFYNDITVILETRRQTLHYERIGANSTINSHNESTAGVPNIKLKKVEIEKFSGDIKKWPQFKSNFEDLFHHANITGSEKFYHLMAHLEQDSEAYNTISGMDRTDANYEAAWKLLCDAYDNERKIVNDIVLSFVDMPSCCERPTRADLIALINRTNSLIQSLPKHGVDVHHWGPILVPLLIRKLDGESIRLWSLERNQREVARIEPLLDFIRKRADGMDAEFVVNIGNSNRPYVAHQSSNQNASFVSKRPSFRGPDRQISLPNQSNNADGNYNHDPSAVKRRRSQCYHCNGDHQLYSCESFDRMSLELKQERLKRLGLCFICLRRGHSSDQCKMQNCRECNQPHNRVLCPKKKPAAAVLSLMQPILPVTSIKAALIGTLKVIASDKHGNQVVVKAFSDGGAHMCMISQRLLQQLKLSQTKLSIPLEGAGRSTIPSKSLVDLKIAPYRNGSNQGEWIQAGVLNSISDRLPPKKFEINDEWKHIQGLPLADTEFNVPDDIDILLSIEFMARIEQEGFRKDEKNPDRPVARKTSFGWIVYGALPESQNYASISTINIADNQRIADSLEKLWQLDAIKERSELTAEEALCTEMFRKSITHSNGRYTVAMPIVPNPPKLGNSLRAAMARQFQNERRFRKDPELKQKYINDLNQFLDMDHMELVPDDEINKCDSEVYYIPHHAANSSKFRVVFDGSVKTSTGISLNDILMNGPRVQEDLTSILMRFRTHRIALTTDITKMYRQILVPEHQRDLLRIVWRENENEPLRHYRLKRQTYGLKSSAYVCIETLRHCAIEHADEFPLASKAVLEAFYVDDGTLGADNEEEAEELYRQLNLMLEKGGFPLAKWATNNQHMQKVIGTTAKAINLELFNENSVLGIKWSVRDDFFKYELKTDNENMPLTKRNIVAAVAQLFDPSGWISPVVVTGKILIQDIWRSKCDWDAIVPDEIQSRWIDFRSKLSCIKEISIPRWIGMHRGGRVEIHGFSDAANKAYGTAFYARVEGPDVIACNLIGSKTRVAPVKGLTIPRMELCGAVMMAQSCEQICEIHGVQKSDLTLWTDSSIVIHWLSKCPTGMKTFVGNRIAEAQELTKGAQWKHVRTYDNPADLASRGVHANDIVNNDLWFHGPSWLRLPKSNWPTSNFVVDQRVITATVAEQKPIQMMKITHREIFPRIEVSNKNGICELLIDRHSSMIGLVRVTALVLRFIDVARKKRKITSNCITHAEYLNAQSVWIRYHQAKYFSKEIAALNITKQVNRDSPVIKMTPFIDGEGIMRVGGRIKRSTMPFDTKHPIILSSEGRFSHLLAVEAHAKTLHGGNQLCIQYIRSRFWMITVRKAIKRVTLKCVRCFRHRKEVAEQLMGDLPAARIVSGHPFEEVGVDYCGPILLKERAGITRKQYKAYIAVFVCMKSKAVYLDLVTDLTTDAFIAALLRLTSTRGSVRKIYSDNATTFHGADNEHKQIFEHWKDVATSESLSLRQITWTFITPLSPSQGGLWERAVRSAKHHLRRIIANHILTYEETITILAQVSAVLNSRPLIALDDDPTAVEALTPAHLLTGRQLIVPLQFDYTEIPDNRLQRWRLIQKMSQQFWQQWHQEYLTQLIERSKWNQTQQNVQIGSIVLVKMENLPPTHWPLGRVVQTFAGEDKLVRNVEVRIGNATYSRGISKIAVLPINDTAKGDDF